MSPKTIEVSDEVYEALDAESRDSESIDDLLGRLLGVDDASEVDAGDVYGSDTNMWTVYDKLDRERREGESLADTFTRLQG